MNQRQIKKAFKQMAATPGGRDALLALVHDKDSREFEAWADQPNGSAQLTAFHDAVLDADDTLQAVDAALDEGDVDEARKLLDLGRESLAERLAELKRML